MMSRVVDEDIDPVEAVHDTFDQGLNVCRLTDIAVFEHDPLTQIRSRCTAQRVIDIGNHDACSTAGKFGRDGLADALRSSRDDGCFTV